jgi:enoyl-CoA hydratase
MNSKIKAGVRGMLSALVGPEQTITLGGNPAASVYSTPSMIHLMEHAAREALQPLLNPEEESVGVDVEVAHVAATPPGTRVTATAIITKVSGKIISFDVSARDRWEEIGKGTHRRAIIKTDSFAHRIAEHKNHQPLMPRGLDLSDLRMLKTRYRDRLLHVELNRPDKKNAINIQMISELEFLCSSLEENDEQVGVVVFTGKGGNFSAGDDVAELDAENLTAMEDLSLRRGNLYRRITGLPQVTVAALEGLAVGGGMVFASACDIRLGTYDLRCGLPEVKLGWPPNYGWQILQKTLGRSKLLDLSLTGEFMDSNAAKSMGWLRNVVPSSQLIPKSSEIAERILNQPEEAIKAIKTLNRIYDNGVDRQAGQQFIKCLERGQARESINRFRK